MAQWRRVGVGLRLALVSILLTTMSFVHRPFIYNWLFFSTTLPVHDITSLFLAISGSVGSLWGTSYLLISRIWTSFTSIIYSSSFKCIILLLAILHLFIRTHTRDTLRRREVSPYVSIYRHPPAVPRHIVFSSESVNVRSRYFLFQGSNRIWPSSYLLLKNIINMNTMLYLSHPLLRLFP